MGSWGSGVFESDNSKDIVADIVDEFVSEIDEALDNFQEESAFRNLNEGVLVLISLIEAICEKAGSAPPEEKAISSWKKIYIRAFDRFGSKEWGGLEEISERKKVIVSCFDSLILFSNEFWVDD